jgi:hypothetical protein
VHVVEACEKLMHRTLPRQPKGGKAFQAWEHPPSGRGRGGWVAGVRHRLVRACQWLTHAAWRHRVDPPGEGHYHQQPCTPAGLFDKQRGDQQQGVFEQSYAAFDARLAVVGRHDRGSAQRAGADMGAKPTAGLDWLVGPQRLRIGADSSLDWPCDRLQGGARCGTACAGIALVCDPDGGVERVVRPALGHAIVA